MHGLPQAKKQIKTKQNFLLKLSSPSLESNFLKKFPLPLLPLLFIILIIKVIYSDILISKKIQAI